MDRTQLDETPFYMRVPTDLIKMSPLVGTIRLKGSLVGNDRRVMITTMSDRALETVRRPLTDHERELVVWLVDHGTSQDRPTLQDQIPRLTVRERCTCGCPTVYFALDGHPVPTKGERLVSDYLATVDGMEVGVMLFETDGHLSSLEVYSCAGTDQPFGLPEVASIRPYGP